MSPYESLKIMRILRGTCWFELRSGTDRQKSSDETISFPPEIRAQNTGETERSEILTGILSKNIQRPEFYPGTKEHNKCLGGTLH